MDGKGAEGMSEGWEQDASGAGRTPDPWISVMHGTGPWHLKWEGDSAVRMTYSDGDITFMDTLVRVERRGPLVHVIARNARKTGR